MFQRIKCKLGRHDWEYTQFPRYIRRTCRNCGYSVVEDLNGVWL